MDPRCRRGPQGVKKGGRGEGEVRNRDVKEDRHATRYKAHVLAGETLLKPLKFVIASLKRLNLLSPKYLLCSACFRAKRSQMPSVLSCPSRSTHHMSDRHHQNTTNTTIATVITNTSTNSITKTCKTVTPPPLYQLPFPLHKNKFLKYVLEKYNNYFSMN